MIKFFCDRCGKEINLETFSYFQNPGDRSSLTMGVKNNLSIPEVDDSGNYSQKTYTLCTECMGKVKEILRNP